MTQLPGMPQPYHPPPLAYPTPARVEVVPGTPFGVAIPSSPPISSGMATGSLITGIASIVVSFAVVCLGIAGASGGWGPWAGGAFAILAGLLGVAGVVLGGLGRRQVRRAAAVTGKGVATAGIVCGGVGLLFAIIGAVGAILLAVSNPTQ